LGFRNICNNSINLGNNKKSILTWKANNKFIHFNKTIKMRKHHKIILGGFSTVVLIFMIVAAILLNGIIVKQQVNHNQVINELSNLETETQEKINELAISVINTNQNINSLQTEFSSVNDEINYLKAETKDDFSGVIEEAIKSVVTIRTLSSQGTGFIVANPGYVVTNLHVLRNDMNEISKVIQVITEDQQILPANHLASIESLDLALLVIPGNHKKLDLADSEEVVIGERVIAIGNPQGFQFSVTDGIISATGRAGANGINAYIQTNAELNPGNSGGPLINKQGEVIGMNNFKIIESEGLGFALESNYIMEGVNLISQEILNQTLI
jgi:S1-C subfamily serine protease